jgi:hypothetical protein
LIATATAALESLLDVLSANAVRDLRVYTSTVDHGSIKAV